MTRVSEGFQGLLPFMQRAVILKANGASNAEIAKATGRSVKSVERWFSIGGILRRPLAEYSQALADEAWTEAQLLVRQAIPEAIKTLQELSTTSTNAAVRQQAAKTLAQHSIIAITHKTAAQTERSAASRALDEMLETELAAALVGNN